MEGKGAVVDRFCKRSPYGAWFLRMPKATFISTLTRAGLLGPDALVTGISKTPLPDSPRTGEVILTTDGEPNAIKATMLRRVLGYTKLKSTWFNVGFEGDEVVFAGRGFGHGVGLCQWGAKGMAEAGYAYRDILKHYYTDAEIGRLY
jgi:stage II sporulation protein D